MSGPSVALEQPQAVDIAESNSLNFAHEASDISQADRIAAIFEKYGHELILDHDGQQVTVEYAYYNCPPYARLVNAMGEAAVFMAAPNLPKEEEAEETETDEEDELEDNQDKAKLKQQPEEPKEKLDKLPLEKDVALEQENRRAEQPQASEASEEGSMTTNNVFDKTEAAASNSKASSNISSVGTVNTPPFEKTARSVVVQEMQPAESSAGVESQPTKSKNDYPLESKNSEWVKSAPTEAFIKFSASAEADTQPKVVKKALGPKVVSETIIQVAEKLSVQFNDNPQIDNSYQTSKPSIGTNHAGIEAGSIQGDHEPDQRLSTDEQWQAPKEFIEHELAEAQTSRVFIPPAQEISTFNALESRQDSPKAINKLSLPVEEVEHAVWQIADGIEKLEVKQKKEAYQLLDEIVRTIVESQTSKESSSQYFEVATGSEKAEEKLTELFIQLFDRVEIEYSPELIESCVKLALQGDMSELIAKIEQQDEEEIDTPHDQGTHEVIKQLLMAVASIKKSVLQAYRIGQSVLRLYSQQLRILDQVPHPWIFDAQVAAS